MMKLSLQPTLLPSEKDSLRVWLIATLQHEKFENVRSFPLVNRLVLVEGTVVRVVRSGLWETSSNYTYLAQSYDEAVVPLSDRLAILCVLAQYCDDSVELREAMQKAITRYLLGEYQALSGNLVNSSVQPRGIAFSTTGGVASLFESGWMTPSGESVDVSGDDWVVCATELPQPSSGSSEPVVDTNFNAEEFRVGDRVSWVEIPGVGRHIGNGEVIETGERLRVREGNLVWIFTNNEELLSHE